MRTIFTVLFSTLLFAMNAQAAAPIRITPTSDGSLYVCDGCDVVADDLYLMSFGYIQGVVKFSTELVPTSPIESAYLTVNPYGLSLFDQTVEVFGYGTSVGQLDLADANAGTFLGFLLLPTDLDYGERAFFDVTSFVSDTEAPFLAFNLRTTDIDIFSSLEYNYGAPAELLISTVPEVSTLMLMLAGLGVLSLSYFRPQELLRLRRTAPNPGVQATPIGVVFLCERLPGAPDPERSAS